MSTIRIEDWDGLQRRRVVRARVSRALLLLLLSCAAFGIAFALARASSHAGSPTRNGHAARPPAVGVPPLGGGVPRQLATVPALPAALWVPPRPHPAAPSSGSRASEGSSSGGGGSTSPSLASSPTFSAPAPASHPAPTAQPAPEPAPTPAPAQAPAPAHESAPSGGSQGSFDSSG